MPLPKSGHCDQKSVFIDLVVKGPKLSLDSASVSIPHAPGTGTGPRTSKEDRVDLPMRAFAGGFYRNLKHMYDHLGIRYHDQPFVFEFAKASPRATSSPRTDQSYFVYASNLHKLYFPGLLDVSKTVSWLMEALYLLACYAWFTFCCCFVPPKAAQGVERSLCETLGEYLERIWLPRYFTTFYLVPLISSVATCPHETLLSFPASDLVDYKRRTNRAPHYTVSNGVHTVQTKLAKDVQYELGAMVTSVEPHGQQVRVQWGNAESGAQNEEVFDRVVLAVTPDVVGKVFTPLHNAMARIPTMEVESVVHTDRSLLRTEERLADDAEGAQLIYLRTSTDNAPKTESLHVQPCGAVVTTCPFSPVDPAHLVHSAKFTRVLRSPESRRIVNYIFGLTQNLYEKAPQWRNGDDNVWLVGGWCWDGMVLLEGCVVSAMRVAKAFEVEIPWM